MNYKRLLIQMTDLIIRIRWMVSCIGQLRRNREKWYGAYNYWGRRYRLVVLWDHVENNNRTYACSVVALCNLAKYYRENGYDKISRSFTTLYDTMWDYAGTNDEGTTSNGREAPAAQRYLNELGYKCTYSSYYCIIMETLQRI